MTKILVVDDAKDINLMISNYLRKQNIEVISAHNGREAITKLEEGGKFDIILLDIIMPDQDGFDVLSFIDENDVQAKIIGISGGGMAISGDVALRSIKARVSETLEKPFKPEALMEAINRVLGTDKAKVKNII
jgi:DNA-binding NtrC family response regulator